MNWLMRSLATSVGKKFVMAITGLLLCLFLLVHLSGNLLLYVGEDAYNHYAHTLHSQEWLVKTAEVGLFFLFVLHIVLAIVTTRENRAARPVADERKQTKQEKQRILIVPAHSWMFLSGAIVLAFLLLHLADFTFDLREGPESEEPFQKAVRILKDGISRPVYVIGSIILGIHLSHGFASLFQSLGISHPKYDSLIRWLGILFAVAIGAGFASFPMWATAR